MTRRGGALLRRVLRIIGWVVVAVLLLLAACVVIAIVWLHTGSGRSFVRKQIEVRASNTLAGTVHIGALSGPILRDPVLHEVVVRAQSGAVAARIDEVRLHYSLWHLLFTPRQIGGVVIERPVIHLDQLAALKSVSNKPTPEITIEHLRVVGGRLLTRDDRALVDRIELRARLALGQHSAATLRSLSARLHHAGHTRPLSAVGLARWSKAQIAIPRLELTSARSRLSLQGKVDRQGEAPQVDLKADAQLAASDLRALTPLPAEETLALTIRARGTPAAFDVALRSNLPAAVGVGDEPLYGQARIVRRDGELRVDPLRLEAGRNRLEGALEKSPKGGAVRLDALTLRPSLMRALTPLAPTVPLTLSGHARADRRRVTAALQLGAQKGRLWLTAHLDRRQQRLTGHLRTQRFSPRTLDERAPAGAIDSALAIVAALGRPWQGRVAAHVSGRVAGQLIRDGALRATLRHQRLRLAATAQVGPRQLRALVDVHQAGPRIEVPRGIFEFGHSSVSVRGRWSPERGARLLATATLRPDDVHLLWPELKLRQPAGLRLTAAGPPDDVEARLLLTLGQGRLAAAARLDVPRARAELHAALTNLDTAALGQERRILVSGALAARGRRDESGLWLDQVELAHGKLRWRGQHPSSIESLRLRGQAHLGSTGRIRLAQLSGVWNDGQRSRALSARGEARWNPQHHLFIDSAWVVGRSALAVSGSLGVAPTLAARQARAQVQLSIDRQLWAELEPRLAAEQPLLLGLSAEGKLGSFLVRGKSTGLAGKAGSLLARLQLRDEDYRVSKLNLRFGQSRLSAQGRLRQDRLRSRLELALAADDVHRLVPTLDPRGPLRLQATAAGPSRRVALRARLIASPGTLHLSGRFNLNARRGRLRLVMDGVDPRAFKKGTVAGQLSAALAVRGRWPKQGLSARLRLDHLRGTVRGIQLRNGYARGSIRHRQLQVRPFALQVPGADVAGRLRASFAGTLDAHVGLRVTDALKLPAPLVASLVLGADQALVKGSVVTVHFTKKPGQKLQRHINLLLPGERTLKKIWNDMTH